MEDEPKFTMAEKVKNPKRVEQGKRLAAISKKTKARKAAERKKAEEECIENSNLLYETVGVLGVAGLGYGVYNFFCKKEGYDVYNFFSKKEEEQPQQQQEKVEQQQEKVEQPEEKNNFDDL